MSNEEVVLSQYGDVIAVEPQVDRDAYMIVNAAGKVWELTGEDIEAGRKGTPMVRFMVTWQDRQGLHYMGHTAKPTALAHVRGLKRNPQVAAIAIYPVTGEEQ